MSDSFLRIEVPPFVDLGAADALAATVRLDVLNAPLNATEGIAIKFYGVQRVAYNSSNSGDFGNIKVHEIDVHIAPAQMFQPDSYAFPVLLTLPANLPASFSYSHSNISARLSYMIEAKARTGLFSFDFKSDPVPVHVIPSSHPSDRIIPGYARKTTDFVLDGTIKAFNSPWQYIKVELRQIATLELGALNRRVVTCTLTTLNFPGICQREPGLLRVRVPIPAHALPTISTKKAKFSYEVHARLVFAMGTIWLDPVAAIPITILASDTPPLHISPKIAEADSSPTPPPTFGGSIHPQPLSPPSALGAHWVRIAGPALAPNALRVGSDADESPLFIARALVSGSLQLGKAGPNLPTALFSYASKEIPVRGEYEVLLPASGLGWAVPQPIPDRAVALGVEASGELLYVVRAKALNAGWFIAATKETREDRETPEGRVSAV
ncbi:hypothetical protein BDK51DRAFT_32272 [Blyttiomyces helicus]|uniref:Uncharacterized protein n=1 Tax=Blyttiomyces helicus TaxID=388810 RepID=A0A4P9WFJ3_9FUNG|nr:hypothetical protein BDK51DRAFT_32272 [Blyttiomyces helicus]|eukprot:RKO91529.1 hypothetical protein BDK51DRAFT_32272 [Blyttiomyces helicus]